MIDKALNWASKWLGSKEEDDIEDEVLKEEVEPRCLRLAKSYHGLHERQDRDLLKALLGFDPVKTPWCAGFVNSIEKMAGRKGTGKLLARSYLKYGTLVNAPTPGDIVVFQRGNSSWQGHVGYYIATHGSRILVLGGNQNNKVCYKYYFKRKVLGYRRPQ